MVKRVISVFVASLMLFGTTSVFAEESFSVSYHADFSQLTGVTFGTGTEQATDPKDSANKAIHFTKGNYKTIALDESIDLSKPLNIEGRFLRAYEGKSNPYWDMRVILNTSADPVMLSAFGKNVYLGNTWENISVYDFDDSAWANFRIRLVKSGDSIAAELFLDGNSYGTTTQTVSGNITGLTVGVLPGAGGGSVYLDDVAYIAETSALTDMLAKVSAETASKEECEEWLSLLGTYAQYATANHYYSVIYDYAEAKGYITVGERTSAFPANNETIYAGSGSAMKYVYSSKLSEDDVPTVTLKKGNDAVKNVTASVSNQTLNISAALEANASYTLEVSGLKNANGTDAAFESVSFTTKNMPIVNVAEGGSYEYGTAISWTDLANVSTTATLTDSSGATTSVTNGKALSQSGDLTLTVTSASGGKTETQQIKFYIIPNSAPEAKNVKIVKDEKDSSVLWGKYDYSDKDNDAQDTEGTVIGWYASAEKDGEYKLLLAGDKLTIDSSMYNQYVKFAVTPKSDHEPMMGSITYSEAYALPFAPEAKNVTVSGSAKVGGTLTGYYDYFDANGDKENADSVMEWVTSSGDVVGTGAAFKPESSHKGLQIAFRVTAKNDVEPQTGKAVTSEYVTIAAASSGGGGSSSSSKPIVGSNSGSVGGTTAPTAPTAPTIPTLAKGEYTDTLNHWSKDAVRELTLKGIVNGMTETTFEPDSQVTRAQFIAMVIRALGIDTISYAGAFSDVSSEAWYADYVQTAVLQGIISIDSHFRPDAPITREEAAKIVTAFLAEPGDGDVTFTDADSISDWAEEYVKAVAAAGLFVGDENGNFHPKKAMTRAEVATVLYRALDLNGGETNE